MQIGCLGWGSLIWKPGELSIAGEWHADGPVVPIEFSRVADGKELATAICLSALPVPVLWARLAAQSLQQACAELHVREAIAQGRQDGIGTLLVHDDDGVDELNRWALERGFDALIWTALPPRYLNVENRVPTAAQAISYLKTLTGGDRAHAKSYIQQVPEQIATRYRTAFSERLEW